MSEMLKGAIFLYDAPRSVERSIMDILNRIEWLMSSKLTVLN